jgi:hypothetical protein
MSDLVSVSVQAQTGDTSTAALVPSAQTSSVSRAPRIRERVYERHVMQLVEGDNATSVGYVYYDEYNATTNGYMTIRRLVVRELVQAVMPYSSEQSVKNIVADMEKLFTFKARASIRFDLGTEKKYPWVIM